MAVARELKQLDPQIRLVYIGQRGDGLADIPAADPNIDAVYSVRAGKFRRYHGLSIAYQLLKVPTQLRNLRDAVYILIGIWQSYWLLRKLKPEIVFIKGGFVGVPVGLAAAAHKIPFITHDSDAIPGLANRIVARWALLHAVGQPKEVYAYPQAKTVTVGVPIREEYRLVSPGEQARYKQELEVPRGAPVLLVTGGGNGAESINEAMVAASPELLTAFPGLVIMHIVGRIHEQAVTEAYVAQLPPAEQGRVVVKGYVTDMYRYSGAADLIVTRAGATSLAEFEAQGKACIIVPNPYLTGGHQLKNAKVLESRGAIVTVQEAQLADQQTLKEKMSELLRDDQKRQALGGNFHALARTDAAKRLAMVLLEEGKK